MSTPHCPYQKENEKRTKVFLEVLVEEETIRVIVIFTSPTVSSLFLILQKKLNGFVAGLLGMQEVASPRYGL